MNRTPFYIWFYLAGGILCVATGVAFLLKGQVSEAMLDLPVGVFAFWRIIAWRHK